MTFLKQKQLLTVLAPMATLSFGVASADTESTDNFDQETTGHLDVHVDHSQLDDAIRNATAKGIKVTREDTKVLTGNAEEYYLKKEKEIVEKIDQYEKDLEASNKNSSASQSEITSANGVMNAYNTNLTTYGSTTIAETKVYDKAEFEQDKAKIDSAIKVAKLHNDLKQGISEYDRLQNSYVMFQTQASQGNIKLEKESVKVSSVADLNNYKEKIKKSYEDLQKHVEAVKAGTTTEKPTFKLYTITIDSKVVEEAVKPVTIYTYEASSSKKLEKFHIIYLILDQHLLVLVK